MSFEILDNLFQLTVLGICAMAAAYQALQRRSRNLLVLCFAYASFAMGTGYYLLHILITGNVPQVFFVAEIAWVSAYLFYLSLQILRNGNIKLRFDLRAAATSLVIGGIVPLFYIFVPSYIVSGIYALILVTIVYLSVFRLKKRLPGKAMDVLMVMIVVLQEWVYIVSAYIRDYNRFNLYFAVDMLLTLSFSGLLPLVLREEKR